MSTWVFPGRLLLAVLALLASACGPSPTRLDRIGPPVRFAQLRETASWCAGFDPEWWAIIDARYAAYDRALDAAVAARWGPFAAEVALERRQGRLPDGRSARAQWARHREITAELGALERSLIVDLDEKLPAEADAFLSLLAARLEFSRASAMFTEPGQVLPGPLEVLALNGRTPLAPEALAAATTAYRELSVAAAAAARELGEDFAALCADRTDLDGAVARAVADGTDARAARTAQQERDRAHDRAMAESTERLRVALLRQGARLGAVIPEGERRDDYLSRLDAYLHEGVRSLPSLRAAWRIGRSLLARQEGVAEEQIAAFDRIYERIVVRDAELRPLLASGSAEVRLDAYRQLVDIVIPMRDAFEEAFGRKSDVADRVDLLTFAVTAGDMSPDRAADAILKARAEAEGVVDGDADGSAPPSEPPLFPGRDRGMQLLLGAPLREGVIAACMARVRLPAEEARRLAPRIAAIRDELAAQTEMVPREIGEELRLLDRGADLDAALRGIPRFMSSLRSKTERVRALDRAANERLLAEIARAARIPVDDERIAITRLEFELLAELGTDRPSGEAEGIGGLTPVALVNPFEVVRSMGADDSQRALAESIVHARGEALLAAHREARTGLERNIRGLLGALLRGSAARQGAVVAEEAPWRAALAGRSAADLRFAIADDLRASIGDFAAESYLARLREIAEPALEPVRAPAFVRLDRAAAGIGLGAAERAATEDTRVVIAELLDQADERRRDALLSTLRWRAAWLAVEPLESRDQWRELARSAPDGWLRLSRATDADERAFAACAALLVGSSDGAVAAHAAGDFPLVLPMRLRPRFE